MKKEYFPRRGVISSLLGLMVALMLGIVLFSCYPGEAINITDVDTVTTFHRQDADFSKYKTYAMPDSVLYITDKDSVATDPDHKYDQVILDAIDRNMQKIGYQKMTDPRKADVHILPIVTTSTWVGGGCYPSWWCDWYYCYPGWCYPVSYTFTTGTVLVPMLARDEATSPDDVTALWVAGLNGLLANGVNAEARIDARMDQAFAQSPYLTAGK